MNPGGEAEVTAAGLDCDKLNADEDAKGGVAEVVAEEAPNWSAPEVIPNAGVAALLPWISGLVPKPADATEDCAAGCTVVAVAVVPATEASFDPPDPIPVVPSEPPNPEKTPPALAEAPKRDEEDAGVSEDRALVVPNGEEEAANIEEDGELALGAADEVCENANGDADGEIANAA